MTKRLANGRYLLAERLGAGGMAVVFRAWDDRLRVWRAAKVLTGATSHVRARFEREARAMARLHHPGVVAVHDVGEDEVGPWLIMDLAVGGSLSDVLTRQGPLPPRQAVAILRDVLAALDAAHRAGIVHRDVKPQNVLLDAHGRPLLADFGIARLEDPGLTATRATMGTLAYMAPEQRTSAARVDARADVYAAAGTLVTLLTGREPVDLFVDRPATWDGVPDGLIPILRRATAYEPDHRFPSAAAFAEALEAVPLDPTADDRPLARGPAPTLDEPPPGSDTWTDDPLPTAPTALEPPAPAGPPPPPPARVTSWWLVAGLAALPVLVGVGALLASGGPAPEPEADRPWRDTRVTRTDPELDAVLDLALSPDGEHFWYWSKTGLWRARLDGPGAPRRVEIPDPPKRVDLTTDAAGGVFLFAWQTQETARRLLHVTADGAVTSLPIAGVPSPVGDRIAQLPVEGIRLASLDGTSTTPLGRGEQFTVMRLAWSPDGTRVATIELPWDQTQPARLRVVPVDGSPARTLLVDHRLAGGTTTWLLTDVAWLDDHTVLAPKSDESDVDIVAFDADTGTSRSLHHTTGAAIGALTTGAGRIGFVRVVSNEEIWRGTLGPDGLKAPTRVTRRPGVDRVLYAHADDSLVQLRSEGPASRVVRVAADGTETVLHETGSISDPAWWPIQPDLLLRAVPDGETVWDGDRLLLTTHGEQIACGTHVCLTARLDGTSLRRVDRATGAIESAWPGPIGVLPTWLSLSRDGRLLVINGRDGDHTLFDLPAGTSEPFTVALDEIDMPMWNADGTVAVVAGYDGQVFQLVEHPRYGLEKVLYRTDSVVYAGAVSADGTRLWWSEDPLPGEGFVLTR